MDLFKQSIISVARVAISVESKIEASPSVSFTIKCISPCFSRQICKWSFPKFEADSFKFSALTESGNKGKSFARGGISQRIPSPILPLPFLFNSMHTLIRSRAACAVVNNYSTSLDRTQTHLLLELFPTSIKNRWTRITSNINSALLWNAQGNTWQRRYQNPRETFHVFVRFLSDCNSLDAFFLRNRKWDINSLDKLFLWSAFDIRHNPELPDVR